MRRRAVRGWVLAAALAATAVTVVAIAAAVIFALVVPRLPVTYGRLASALGQLDLPPGSRLVHTHQSGNLLCFDSCPSLLHRYAVPGTAAEVEQAVRTSFRVAGWSVRAAGSRRTFQARSPDRAIDVHVVVDPDHLVEEEPVTAPTAPAGHVFVDLSAWGNPCEPERPGCG